MTTSLSSGLSAAGGPQTLACDTSAQRWSTYLAALVAQAEYPEPLETVGTLVRVAGLVLEAAGVRVPVGSICEVRSPGLPTVLAEVVGFNGDRAYLMPTGPVQGLASGAQVVPRPLPVHPPRLGMTAVAAPKDAACTCPLARACWAVSWTRMANRWTGKGRSTTSPTRR